MFASCQYINIVGISQQLMQGRLTSVTNYLINILFFDEDISNIMGWKIKSIVPIMISLNIFISIMQLFRSRFTASHF